VVIRDVMVLGFGLEFRKVKVFPSGARPVGSENAGVCMRRLSIKLDGQGEDSDEGVGMEEALHAQGACEQGRLGKVFVLCKGKEGTVEVAVRQEDSGVSSQVWPKREDAGDGGQGGSKGVVMAGTDAAFSACSIDKDQVSHNKVFGVWDRVNVDGGVVG